MTQRSKPSRNGRLVQVYTEIDYSGGFDEIGPLNLKLMEKSQIIKAAHKCQGDRMRMARCLNVSLRTLYDKLVNHSLKNII